MRRTDVAADTIAQVRRDGDTLVFSGALMRAAVAPAWRQAQPLRADVRRLDLTALARVDSAGLALLAELAEGGLEVDGEPAGFAELRGAYRLDAALGFAR
jgi:phospholipid transport system transporter-binding protein